MDLIPRASTLPTGGDVDETVSRILSHIDSGEEESLAIKYVAMMKVLSETMDRLKKHPDFRGALDREVSLQGDKTFKAFGCEFTPKNTVRYSYKECNDPEWARLDVAKKRREDYLKGLLNRGVEDIITNTDGEEILPPRKSVTPSLSVKLPKW